MKTKTTEIPAIIDEAKAAGCENADQINGYLAAEVSRLREVENTATALIAVEPIRKAAAQWATDELLAFRYATNPRG